MSNLGKNAIRALAKRLACLAVTFTGKVLPRGFRHALPKNLQFLRIAFWHFIHGLPGLPSWFRSSRPTTDIIILSLGAARAGSCQ